MPPKKDETGQHLDQQDKRSSRRVVGEIIAAVILIGQCGELRYSSAAKFDDVSTRLARVETTVGYIAPTVADLRKEMSELRSDVDVLKDRSNARRPAEQG